MPQHRLTPRIYITLNPEIFEMLNAFSIKLRLSRSQIIREALSNWLREHREGHGPQYVNGKIYDPHKNFNYYLTPDMGTDDYLRVLQEYEAAQRVK